MVGLKTIHLKNLVVIEDVTSEKVSRKLLNMHPELSDKTEWEIFESFFNDIVELLVEHTNRYANRDKNNLQSAVTKDEMMKFIGIIFLSLAVIKEHLEQIIGVKALIWNV